MNYKIIKSKIYNIFFKPTISFKMAGCSFDEAKNKCSGYDCDSIFEKSSNAALNVKNGLAKFERDGVEFDYINYYYELLYLVEKIINIDGFASVLDFGGGFGSMYYQHKDCFEDINIRWFVYEQERFVNFGHANLENNQIRFIDNLDKCEAINFIILGSVLQYIQDYNGVLNEILQFKARYILVDRTPFTNSILNNNVFIETVHEPIYEASYPLYVFERDKFIKYFEECGYRLIDSWSPSTGGSFYVKNIEIDFDSLLFRAI